MSFEVFRGFLIVAYFLLPERSDIKVRLPSASISTLVKGELKFLMRKSFRSYSDHGYSNPRKIVFLPGCTRVKILFRPSHSEENFFCSRFKNRRASAFAGKILRV